MSKLEQDQLRNLITKTGFDNTFTEVYITLLLIGQATIHQLVEGFPQVDIHGTMEKLLKYRFIGEDIIREKNYFFPLDPAVAWGAYMSEVTWFFYNYPMDYKKIRYHHTLPSEVNHTDLHTLQDDIKNIQELASKLYKSQPPIFQHHWREIFGPENMAKTVAEAIANSKKKVRSTSRPPRLPQVSLVWEAIVKCLGSGINYKHITNLLEIIEHGLYISQRDVENYGVNIYILELPKITHKYYIIDNDLVIIYYLDNLRNIYVNNNTDIPIGRLSTRRETITRYRQKFDQRLFPYTIPALDVIRILRKESENLLARAKDLDFSASEVERLECVINWGIFCKEPNLPDGFIKKAYRAGLLMRGSTGQPIPNYKINMRQIRSRWDREY